MLLSAAANLFAQTTMPLLPDYDPMVGISILAAAVGLAVWFLSLWSGAAGNVRFRIERNIKKPHYIQALCQFSIYVYWGLYWSEVSHYAPLIATQLVFAYLLDMLLSWSRGRVWYLGFGPFPIVFSINFFLWFKEPYFYLQLLLIAFTVLSKEFITWNRGGRRAHIFNPSAFPLAVASLLMIFTGTIPLSYGRDIIWSFYLPPNLYEVVFLLGLVVQFLFSTTLITMGGFIALFALYFASQVFLGITVSALPVDVSVLLGLTFLVTDPATSPRNSWGKLLFGLTYGAGIFAAYVILRLVHQPSYFDKILMVPVVNLLSPWFERIGARMHTLLDRPALAKLRYQWAFFLALYVGCFVGLLPKLKGPVVGFVDPLPEVTFPLSSQLTELRIKHGAARLTYPEAYGPFGFEVETRHFDELRDFEPRTAQQHANFGNALVEVGARERALASYRRALDIDSNCAAAHISIGNALLQSDKADLALEHLSKAVELAPDDGNAHLSMGTALGMKGQPDKAVPHLRKAVELSPANADAYVNLGTALMGVDRPGEAMDTFREALKVDSSFGPAHLKLGAVLLQSARTDEAITHLRRASALLPADSGAQQLLGMALKAQLRR